MLNERNEKTKMVIHLLVTDLCARDCPHCCNKQYDVKDIPIVTDEELMECHTVCLTGGEPILFADPNAISELLKRGYGNIKAVYLYANAFELFLRLSKGYQTRFIDGFSVSIKNDRDLEAFRLLQKRYGSVFDGKSNRVYVFDGLLAENEAGPSFRFVKREWQEDFVPADDSIFRKLQGVGDLE